MVKLVQAFRLYCSLADSKPLRQFLMLSILGAVTYTTQTPITVHIDPGTGMRKGG